MCEINPPSWHSAVIMLYNPVMPGGQEIDAYAPWGCLTIVGRRPCPYSLPAHQDDGPELFGDFDLWLGLGGTCSVEMLGRPLELREGRVILIPPGVSVRQFTGPGQELCMVYAHFDCRISGEPIRNALQYVDPAKLQMTLPGLPTVALVAEVDSATMSEKLHRIRRRPDDEFRQLMMSIVLLETIGHLRQTYLGLAGSALEERLGRATTFFESNMDRRISLAEAARHVHVSPETLGRLFGTHYQISPMRYLTRLRMARARELLQDRRYNISEVGRACGYASLQYFSRAFRKEFGVPPRAFRKQLPLIP
jgi:AraC-like DNA-binding protein